MLCLVGVSVTAASDRGQTRYFYFPVSEPNSTVAFILTAYDGDPDLYVDLDEEQPGPGKAHWSSYMSGSDVLVFENANTTAPYHIGVHGFSNTSFSIMAVLRTPNATDRAMRLSDGRPQSDFVTSKGYRYYTFILPNDPLHDEVTFTVSRMVGDPDVYVNNNGIRPNSTSFWKSSSAFGGDLISVRDPVPGVYTIAVFGFTASQYTITAATNDTAVVLRVGEPFSEELYAHQYEYFVFGPVTPGTESLTFYLTAFNGDPDLFISTIDPKGDPAKLPGPSFNNYSSQAYSNDRCVDICYYGVTGVCKEC